MKTKSKIGVLFKMTVSLSCVFLVAVCLSPVVSAADSSAIDSSSYGDEEIVIGSFKYTRIDPGSNDLVFRGYVTTPSGSVDVHIEYEVSDGNITYHVREIGENVFYYESSSTNNVARLRSVEIDDGIECIRDNAFRTQSSLASVEFPETLKTIGDGVFIDCASITSVVVPDSVTSIGEGAFSGCMGMESLTIGNGLTVLPYCCFSGLMSLNELKIGENVLVIGESCFMQMQNITKLVIPDSVVVIGEGAFGGCARVNYLAIGKNVRYIGTTALEGMGLVQNLVIPENVCYIGTYAFAGFDSLRHVEFRNGFCVFDKQAFGQGVKFFNENGIEITDTTALCGKTFDFNKGSFVVVPRDASADINFAIAIGAILALIVVAGIFRR